MDGNQGPEVVPAGDGDYGLGRAGSSDDGVQDLLAICSRVLRDVCQAEDPAGMIEQYQRLDELHSALDALRTRLQLDVFLGSVSGLTLGPGRSPMASEAVERLRRAINVIANRDT
ncbi:hypothetical protein [Arthrobacter sp. NicSoilC12]|uniref:hypothetical protein n=1 Tax=Arthrobacter sp. NicSoilC12 TaxID=2831001 RepID=UPI001CC4491B|nr:hypothetical protein [Arthrobacter sp. NicSoilC12]GIU56411.1 hypothetical protein NicSoilC12_21600 [Arthrobacter sp. NicSoilC12]